MKTVIPFLGLSFAEWSGAGLMEYQEPSTFLWKGSFPALWADRDPAPNRDLWYQGYVAAYLERDVRNMLNIGSLRDFERFLRAAASRTGQPVPGNLRYRRRGNRKAGLAALGGGVEQ